MSGALIRAGGAFVEMLVKDEAVKASLENLKSEFRNFGVATNAIAAQSVVAMNASASAGAIQSAASVGALTGSMFGLRAVAISLGNVFRATFGFLTTSVTRAFGGIAALTLLVGRFAGRGSLLSGWLNKFLGASQTTEAIGRWTRFAGMITGNTAFRNLGNQIERLGLGSAIVQGFTKGGLGGGISSAFGAAFRSSKSIILGSIASVFTSPLRLIRSLGSEVGRSVGAAGPAALAAVPQVNALTGAITRTAGSSRVLAGTRSLINSFGAAFQSLAIKAIAFSAAITGPAFLAARSFASASSAIMADARSTGKSIAELIQLKYGSGSLISAEDVKAGAALSDAMSEAKRAITVAWAQIGAAALPVLKSMAEFSRATAEAISGLLAANRDLITTAVTVAAKIGGTVAALLAVWKAAVMLAPVFAALASPLGLVAAGIVGIAIAFPQLRQEAQDVFQFLFGNFGELLTIVQQTMEGVMDAMAGGSLQAAGRVLWSGLYAAWIVGTEQLRSVYRNMVNNIAVMGIDAFSGLQSAWVVTVKFLADAWAMVLKGFLNVWNTTQNAIAGGLARVFATIAGVNVNDVLAELNEMQAQEAKSGDDNFTREWANREKLTKQKLNDIKNESKAMQETLAEDFAARQKMADAEKDAALQEFADARAEAAKLKAERFKPKEFAAAVKASFDGNIGSFSAASAGRIGVAGVNPLQKSVDETARNTATIAKNGERNPFEFVA